MKYYSLAGHTSIIDFREATLLGQAPDKGLYFPTSLPSFPDGFVESLPTLAPEEVAFTVMHPFVGEAIPKGRLQDIAAATVAFPIPLRAVSSTIQTLELFHGPTLAFKDVGARFMSRCLGYFTEHNNREITVLVATSGDTGGAVANGFLGVEGVRVVILYPAGRVSKVQEQQLTALGGNVTAYEVDGTFDDCQRMVKAAFVDSEFSKRHFLTSANSINVARWLPQQIYYVLAAGQSHAAPVISVPSGNFGNLAAGILAWKRGLAVAHFIAACNANDVVPEFLTTGHYRPRPAVATVSNAMDVGDPSNWVRVMALFENNMETLRAMLSGARVAEEETLQTMREVYDSCGYVLDPHGAVGYKALRDYLLQHTSHNGYFLETAHPVKFEPTVYEALGKHIEVPAALDNLMKMPKQSIRLGNQPKDLFDAMS
jgi:threonine synthase